MSGPVILMFTIDFIFTVLVAIGTSWFFNSRQYAKRTSEHLGKDDVALFNEQHSILIAIDAYDDMVGETFALPEKVRVRVKEALKRYNKTEQLPY